MKVTKRAAIAAAAVAVAGAAIPALAKSSSPQEPTMCGGTDVQLTISQNLLWPPNHKMVPITITATDADGDGDNGTVSIGQITNSDETNGIDVNGSGKPDTTAFSDETGSNQMQTFKDPQTLTFNISLAAERSGHDNGSGRTYSIPVTCSEMSGNDITDTGENSPVTPRMGNATLTVFVPHDQGNS